MNENELKGNWQVVQGRVREKWGKLTDQDLQVIAGKRDQLVGRLRERYGHAEGEAERLVKEFDDEGSTL
ncbi:MAG: CsbD family protein [Gemmatimonadaceae bacterium]